MTDKFNILLMTTLGESILVETIRAAVYYVTHSNSGFQPVHRETRSLFREGKQCYFFLQGTALDQLIETYALDYDPESIREGFNYYARRSA